MDIDVNRPAIQTKVYEVAGVQFRGVVPTQMIADKLSAISTNKVFRRIKDVVDLYYISKVFTFDKTEVLETLRNGGGCLGTFEEFLCRPDDLRHSYEKFRFTGNVNKPSFDEVYYAVKEYIKDILPEQ